MRSKFVYLFCGGRRGSTRSMKYKKTEEKKVKKKSRERYEEIEIKKKERVRDEECED